MVNFIQPKQRHLKMHWYLGLQHTENMIQTERERVGGKWPLTKVALFTQKTQFFGRPSSSKIGSDENNPGPFSFLTFLYILRWLGSFLSWVLYPLLYPVGWGILCRTEALLLWSCYISQSGWQILCGNFCATIFREGQNSNSFVTPAFHLFGDCTKVLLPFFVPGWSYTGSSNHSLASSYLSSLFGNQGFPQCVSRQINI